MQTHHIQQRHLGGKNTDENLVLLHPNRDTSVNHNQFSFSKHHTQLMAIGEAFSAFELYEAQVSCTVLWVGNSVTGLSYPAQSPLARVEATKPNVERN